jgi:hypothetical protein
MKINYFNLAICLIAFFIAGASFGYLAKPEYQHLAAGLGGALTGIAMPGLGFRMFE